MLEDINNAIDNAGGQWVKLRTTTDPVFDGIIITAESRGKTFEGAPVLSRVSGEQRTEWVFTIQTDNGDGADDNGVRKFGANESAQRAIADAVKASGRKIEPGGHIKIGVKTNAKTDREQPVFQAKYEPPTAEAAAAVKVSDIFEEPF